MSEKNVTEAHRLISEIRRSFPDNASTFSKCRTEACVKPARGGGLCVDCLAQELGDLIGWHELARDYRDAIKSAQKIRAKILERSAK